MDREPTRGIPARPAKVNAAEDIIERAVEKMLQFWDKKFLDVRIASIQRKRLKKNEEKEKHSRMDLNALLLSLLLKYKVGYGLRTISHVTREIRRIIQETRSRSVIEAVIASSSLPVEKLIRLDKSRCRSPLSFNTPQSCNNKKTVHRSIEKKKKKKKGRKRQTNRFALISNSYCIVVFKRQLTQVSFDIAHREKTARKVPLRNAQAGSSPAREDNDEDEGNDDDNVVDNASCFLDRALVTKFRSFALVSVSNLRLKVIFIVITGGEELGTGQDLFTSDSESSAAQTANFEQNVASCLLQPAATPNGSMTEDEHRRILARSPDSSPVDAWQSPTTWQEMHSTLFTDSLKRYAGETKALRSVSVLCVDFFSRRQRGKRGKARQGRVKLYLDDEVEDLEAPSKKRKQLARLRKFISAFVCLLRQPGVVLPPVNNGSPAEAAGLRAGDAVIRVNNTEVYNLRHKDAQDVIVRAGNNFELTVQRGSGTWKPHVTPLSSSLPSPSPTGGLGNIAPVTKTSLAANKKDGPHIGSGHNFSPKPFVGINLSRPRPLSPNFPAATNVVLTSVSLQLNGTGDGSIKSIVNKQYNSPVGIYSEETIAETLSAQAEVLAGGVLGVNFKKNEKNYNAENSEVFKMVQEADKEPKTPEPVSLVHAGTITSLRNSGANCAERRDYAVFTGSGRTEASLGTGNQAAATVHAAVKPSTWTEHLCRMREAHRAPTSNNLIGPKPFGGSTVSSPPLLNSGNSTLPRPQSQTVTDVRRTYIFKILQSIIVENTKTDYRPSSVKSKSLAWPPPKPIEDITYPTASPLYIDPNPALDRRSRQAVKEKKACIEACEKALTRGQKRGESTDREVEKVTRQCYRFEEDPMDRVSCPGPVYRKVELVETTSRQSRTEVPSRASSAESVRRSLTPTRIVQPVPKPWTATVTTGSNLYEQSYVGVEPPKVCKKFHQKEICQRERICERNQPFREEHRTYRSEFCRREQTISQKPPLPTQQVTKQDETREETTEIDKQVIDLRPADDLEDEDGDGIKGEHDFITETSEEDIDGMHVRTKMTLEKTVEPSPVRPSTPAVEESREETTAEETVEREEEVCMRRTTTKVEKEQSEEKTVVESAEVVTSAVDVQQLIEKAKQEEEERKREEEEEEKRKQEEEERKRREEEERWRKRLEEEERRRQEEEEQSRHVTFEEEEEVEEVREQPLGRTVVREERVTEAESDTPGRTKLIKETYEEITEEVLVQERVKRKCIEDERKKSLREQVEVHKSLRDQQAPKDRRVCSKYPPAQEIMESNKKRVQFMKQTDTGPKPIPHSALQNATPKEWKSEMVNALTTAPDRPYTPLSTSSSVKEVFTEETIYLDRRCRPKPPPQDLRPISPFQEALTIAPERPYTPLSREIGPEDQKIASRSQTPVITGDGSAHCPPADILFGEGRSARTPPPPKPSTPRPLPTPPPDFRLRDISVSARPQTPCSKGVTAPLKKPDTIPLYQRNLVATRKGAVETHTYEPNRTPTPTPGRCKSPAYGPPEPPSCYVKAQAPRIREDPPPPMKRSSMHFPTKKTVSYKVDEDTDDGHRHAEYAASKTVDFDEKRTDDPGKEPTDAVHAAYQEKRYMTSEETSEEKKSVTRRSLEVTEDFERCEKRIPTRPLPERTEKPREKPPKGACAIGRTSPSQPSLPCPMSSQTGASSPAQPIYSSSTEVRHVSYGTPPSKPCPDTGVTVLPCKAQSDQGTKAGVVVVPCEGPNICCQKSGVCVIPTPDRSGVCVSPCFGGTCGQPSGQCGRESSCDFNVPRNCPESGVCVSPCPDGSLLTVDKKTYHLRDCLNAIGKHFHPECFKCSYCGKLFGNSPFFLEEGLPYCEADWNELFTTKCFACGFPVEAGDRWVEALNNNYHSQCFNCTVRN
ncbi:hypothetical protein E2986_11123 [Frieseomelitta varia]|uniref:PDZ and LIM domain protein Zasp n=1 Tax=Frieseomelitta varia TaxID=561572 RepID=A0A833W0H9_9HYME|nr:hypothetical protein E2986_11123 [Frieseomelitta varia]